MTESHDTAQSPKRVEHRREYHGDVFVDPYEWMRDKSDPEVIAHLEAENAYTRADHRHLAPLRQKIFDEIKARTKETDLSVPTRRGDWWYYGRSFEGKQYGVHCRCPVSDPDDWTPPELDEHTEIPGEQVLLDENVEAEGHDFFALGAATCQPGRPHAGLLGRRPRRRAIHVAVQGLTHRRALRRRDRRHRRGRDLGRRQPHRLLHDRRRRVAARTPCGGTASVAGLPAEQVYHEPDERFWLAVGRTRSDKYVIIAAGSSVTSEIRYGDAADADAEFTRVWPRRELVEYSVEHAVVGGEDRFLILHNDGAENFTLVEAPVSDPTPPAR